MKHTLNESLKNKHKTKAHQVRHPQHGRFPCSLLSLASYKQLRKTGTMDSIKQAEKEILVPPISRGSHTAHIGEDKPTYKHTASSQVFYTRNFNAWLQRRTRQAAILQAPPLTLLWPRELSPGRQLTGFTTFIIFPGSPSQQLLGAPEAFLHRAKGRSSIILKGLGTKFFCPSSSLTMCFFPALRGNLVNTQEQRKQISFSPCFSGNCEISGKRMTNPRVSHSKGCM